MKIKFNKSLLLMFIITAAFLISCVDQNENDHKPARHQKPKYVFLFIGDGMGYAHIEAAQAYLTSQNAVWSGNGALSFTQFPVTGEVTTHSANNKVTCSSAAGTAIAAGVKINNEVVGIDPQGRVLKSFTYDLKKLGYKIGIATSVSIDHATPAAFYASEESRYNYHAIAAQLAPSGFHFFAGSGFLHPMSVNEAGETENIYDRIFRAGYAIVRTKEDLAAAPPPQKILMVQGFGHHPETLVRAIDRGGDAGWTLADFTRTGIERLKNANGFFFMAEGGLIDFVSHDNDYDAMVHEMIDFSQSVKIALDFYEKYPGKTLIIVTSDHETGGLTKAYDNTYHWTTTSHTGVPVPIFAIGAGSELFRGKFDNTDIAKKIKYLMLN
ncbi:MAG: alkaline phosphatase [Chitinispirillia bacterium]|nr:alkaline phosphatase [Chitinispirillia bacterium]